MVTAIRTIILYALVIIVMRIMGKRQIGQLQPFELAIAIMISELAAVPMQDTGVPLINGMIPILTLLLAQITLSFLSIKSIKARTIISGKPRILIKNGKINEHNLRLEMYTVNDLMEQLRIKDICNIDDVEYAILETNGQLSVLPKYSKSPVKVEDMNLPDKKQILPVDIIIDGRILYENLSQAGISVDFLRNLLKTKGINNISEVFFAGINSNGDFFAQTRDLPDREGNN